jgi:hypothetical protein
MLTLSPSPTLTPLPKATSYLNTVLDEINRAFRSKLEVTTEYMEALQPLRHATPRLEERGKAGNFGAIYEIIPVFECLLN